MRKSPRLEGNPGYPGAGHAFFSVNRAAYRPEAAVDGWEKIFAWLGRYLAS